MAERPKILAAVSDSVLVSDIRTAARNCANIIFVSTVRQAIGALDKHGELPIIFAPELSDGSGFEVLRYARALDPGIEAMLVGNRDFELAAANASARFVATPIVDASLLVEFAAQIYTKELARRARIASAVEAWTRAYSLTPSETKLLQSVTVDGVPRRQLATTLGKTDDTVKAHVRHVLQKTKRRTLSEAIAAVLRHALR